MSKRHVFGDRHPLDEAQVLVNEGDALARVGAVAIGLAVDRHGSAVSGDNAAENLDQGGFASAVLAEKGNDLAAIDVEAHALERLRAPERLGDILETQDAGLRQVAFLPYPTNRISSSLRWSSYGTADSGAALGRRAHLISA